MSLALKDVPVAHQVKGLFFTFYSPEEIRKLSTKKLTQPVTFDTLGIAQKNGLYDPALGPLNRDSGRFVIRSTSSLSSLSSTSIFVVFSSRFFIY